MPANINALLRYKTIDNCLRNKYRRWTLEDLVDACSDALYEMEGIRNVVSYMHDLYQRAAAMYAEDAVGRDASAFDEGMKAVPSS